MQLDLFTIEKEFQFERKPNTKELAIISDVFGPTAVDGISKFLDDIIEIYPMKSYWWNSWHEQIFLAIGASKRQDHYFYMLEVKTNNIYFLHDSLTKPYLKKYEKDHLLITDRISDAE